MENKGRIRRASAFTLSHGTANHALFLFMVALTFLTGPVAGAQEPADRNGELRFQKWSVYSQGGLSWATGVGYPNINAHRSIGLSPAAGAGVDFTIRPWVRVGAEYLWTDYRREQRFSVLDPGAMPVQAYGNYRMNVHRAHVGAGFNVMEFWSDRGAQWLNVWAGTGAGYMFGRGNEYGIWFSSTVTQGGATTPVTEDLVLDNGSNLTVTGNVRATNRHESFNSLYVPLSLHVEADVDRQFTVGLKGGTDWLVGHADAAPKNLFHALVTLRFNFVPSRTKVLRHHYQGEMASLESRVKDLFRQAELATEKADMAEAEQSRLQQENVDLRRSLSECEGRETAPPATDKRVSHVVQFDNNSSYFDAQEAARLQEFARSHTGSRLSIIAEASTPGTNAYNQTLSERRLERVINALLAEGFTLEDLKPRYAIGEQNGIPTAEGRIVTLTVEE